MFTIIVSTNTIVVNHIDTSFTIEIHLRLLEIRQKLVILEGSLFTGCVEES